MAKKIRNRKSHAMSIVTDAQWQDLFVDKGVHKLYEVVEEFPDTEAVKKPFIPREITERKAAVERAEENEGQAPTLTERRQRPTRQAAGKKK